MPLGAWGKVKKGTDKSTSAPVAIKVIHKRRLKRKLKDGIDRVYQEYALVRSLQHPNILKYHNLIETDYQEDHVDNMVLSDDSSSSIASISSSPDAKDRDGKLYLVMEWLGDGLPLSEWLLSGETSKLNRTEYYAKVRSILKQLLSALAYLAQKKISHHDIKLENVIYNEKLDHVTLIDFGIAEQCHVLVDDESKEPMAFSGFGTPAYQPPEVIMRKSPSEPFAGHRADMWSLGVLAYQLAKRHPTLPFEADSIYAVLERIISSKRPSFAGIKSVELIDLISRLLERSTALRPTAAQALCHPFMQNLEFAEKDAQFNWFDGRPLWRKFLCM